MSILSTVTDKLNPYMIWIKVGLLLVAVSVVFGAGYKVGEWKQGLADSQDVQASKDALLQNAVDVAVAQKKARDDAQKEYEQEILALNQRNEGTAKALSEYQEQNKTLASKNTHFAKIIEGLRHDKSNAEFLDTPIPAAIRNSLLKPANQDSAPGSAGNSP